MIGKSRGFTLIELMIAVTVAGIMSALAIPAYKSYIDTANMTKVSANFEEAVRLAQMTFAKDKPLLK
jgi:type IV pilus assembly protein PilA